MNEEMMINMISNCAKMEAALNLLRNLMVKNSERDNVMLLDADELNMILTVAGFEPIEEKKRPN